MERARKKGIAYSAAFHLLLFLLLIFGLPSLLKNEPPIEPPTITVELLPITGVTNVKPTDGEKAEKPKPEEPKKEPEQKKPAPPVNTTPTPPPPPPPEPKPEPKPEVKKTEPTKVEEKPEPKPEPKKEEPKEKPPEKRKKQPKEEDLDAILKAVKDTAQKEKKPEKSEDKKEKTSSTNKAISNKYDASQPMSLSEIDAIMSQLAKCWTPPAGAKNAQDLVVIIDAEFNIDGTYVKAELSSASRSRYNSDPFFRSAADAALRAVRQCSPIKNLPPDKYDTWKNLELHFSPQNML